MSEGMKLLNLPENFYISGAPRRRVLSKLFRPKELREFVFPEFGMIMYDLFWVKYTLFMIKEGYIPWEQNYLFFWAEKDSKIDVTKSVLFYSVLSRTQATLNDKEEAISVGGDFARHLGLFAWEWRDKVALGLLEFSKKGRAFNFHNFVEEVFHSDFKSDCGRFKVDLDKIAKEEMINAFEKSKTVDSTLRAVESFCVFTGKLLHDREIIKEYPNASSAVVDPNIDFTKKILLNNKTDLQGVEVLANTNFWFTKEEVEALLNRMLQTELGNYFVASVILVAYLDPINNSQQSLEKKLREIYDIIKGITNFENQVTNIFSGLKFPQEIYNQLLDVCLYWEFNFFLSDGETLARQILENKNLDNKELISKREIETIIAENDIESRNFKKFLSNLDADSQRKTALYSFIKTLQKTDNDDTGRFVQQLLKSLKSKKDSFEIFIDLLIERGTLEEYGLDQYRVTGTFKQMSDAEFYGIPPLTNWTKRMLRGLKIE